jgi:hypothetical protein
MMSSLKMKRITKMAIRNKARKNKMIWMIQKMMMMLLPKIALISTQMKQIKKTHNL